MRKISFKLTGSISLCLLLSVSVANADIAYEQITKTNYVIGQGKKITEAVNQKIYIKGKRIRIEDIETGKVTLIQFDNEKMYKLDTKASAYSEASFRTLKILQGQQAMQSKQAAPQRAVGMDAARQQLQKLTEGLPPERRSFMEQMMMRQQSTLQGGGASADTKKVKVKETDETKIINGFPCRRVKVVQNRKKVLEAWVTKKIGPTNYYTQLIETLGLFKPAVLKAVKKIEGFPIRQKYRVQTGSLLGVIQTTEVTKIEETTLSENLFKLPEGYKKQAKEEDYESFEEEEESF